MKKETFDIPAYNFFVITASNISFNKETSLADISTGLEEGTLMLIPFETVDGLTIKETLGVLQAKEFGICCGTKWQGQDGQLHISLLDTLLFEKTLLKRFEMVPIDQLVEREYEQQYTTVHEDRKRCYRCFFERYQDRTYQETEKRVTKINKKIIITKNRK